MVHKNRYKREKSYYIQFRAIEALSRKRRWDFSNALALPCMRRIRRR